MNPSSRVRLDSTTTKKTPPSKRSKRHSKRPERAAGNAPNRQECTPPQHQSPPQQCPDGFGSSSIGDPLDNPAVVEALLEAFQVDVSSKTTGSSNNEVPPAAHDSRTQRQDGFGSSTIAGPLTTDEPALEAFQPEILPKTTGSSNNEALPAARDSSTHLYSVAELLAQLQAKDKALQAKDKALEEERTLREKERTLREKERTLREKAATELAAVNRHFEELSVAFAYSDSTSSVGPACQLPRALKEKVHKMGCLGCSCKSKGAATLGCSPLSPSGGSNSKSQPPSTPSTAQHPTVQRPASSEQAAPKNDKEVVVTVAHIITNHRCASRLQRNGYLPQNLPLRQLVCDDRNVIPLCGSHGEKGTCHHKFDAYTLGFFKRGDTGSMTSESGTTLNDGSTSQKNEWIMFEIGNQEGSAVGGKRKLTVTMVDFQDCHPRRSVMRARSLCALWKAGLSTHDLAQEVQRLTQSVTYQRIVAWLDEVTPEISPDTTGTTNNELPPAATADCAQRCPSEEE